MAIYGKRKTVIDLCQKFTDAVHRQLSQGWPLSRVQETRKSGMGQGSRSERRAVRGSPFQETVRRRESSGSLSGQAIFRMQDLSRTSSELRRRCGIDETLRDRHRRIPSEGMQRENAESSLVGLTFSKLRTISVFAGDEDAVYRQFRKRCLATTAEGKVQAFRANNRDRHQKGQRWRRGLRFLSIRVYIERRRSDTSHGRRVRGWLPSQARVRQARRYRLRVGRRSHRAHREAGNYRRVVRTAAIRSLA